MNTKEISEASAKMLGTLPRTLLSITNISAILELIGSKRYTTTHKDGISTISLEGAITPSKMRDKHSTGHFMILHRIPSDELTLEGLARIQLVLMLKLIKSVSDLSL